MTCEFEVTGYTNPAILLGALVRSMRLPLVDSFDEDINRLAAYCSEPVGNGFCETEAEAIQKMNEICADSGVGLKVWCRDGQISVEPSDPLQSVVVEDPAP